MAIAWRERVVAAAIHFVVTLFLAGLAAALIFFVWFRDGMAGMVGGTNLFLLVVASDLVLGPLMSLVIYSSSKPRRELFIDYSIVGIIQIAALVYGVLVVASSRPVYVAFDVDRFEIITAIEIDESHLAAAKHEEFRSLPWWGWKTVAVERPTDPVEKSDLVFLALAGKDAEYLPKYYRQYDTALTTVRSVGLPIDALLEGSGDLKPTLEAAIADTNRAPGELRWLLLRHRFGFGVVLLDAVSAQPLKFLPYDPTWLKDKRMVDHSSLKIKSQ